MQHLILHIGRHKTGTTALQFTCAQNMDSLSDAGIHYPEAGREWVAHHPVADIIHGFGDPSADPFDDERLSGFLSEIRTCGKNTILVSSEGFQRCDPEIVKRIFGEFRVTVVVYIRNPLSYLQSSYLQAIHAEDYSGSIEEYEQDRFFCDYEPFLASWEHTFAEENVITRVFSEECLESGDVVTDFFQVVLGEKLGIPVVLKADRPNDASSNISLKGQAIPFKKRLNAVLENDHYYFAELYKALGSYSGAIVENMNLVSKDLAIQLREKYRESNTRVLEKLSLPTTLLDFPIPASHRTIEWMDPRSFHEFLQRLTGIDDRCGILVEDCYSVRIENSEAGWILNFCRNVEIDSLPLVKIRHGDTVESLPDIGHLEQGSHVIPGDRFDPAADSVFLDFGDGQTAPIRKTGVWVAEYPVPRSAP